MSDHAAKRPHLPALTGLRFFAALQVVLYHLREVGFLALGELPWLDRLIARGNVAVSFFFVLSGFVLAYVHLDAGEAQPLDRRAFYWQRWSRIYPTYLFGLVITLPFFLAGMLHGPARGTSGELLAVGGLTLGLLQAWDPYSALRWNAPGWSLSAEAFFYLMFPFVATAYQGASRAKLGGALVRWYLFALLFPVLYVVFPAAVREATGWSDGVLIDVVQYNPLIRWGEFVFGMALGKIFLLRGSATLCAQRMAGLISASTAGVCLYLLIMAPRVVELPGLLGDPPRQLNLDLLLRNGLLAPLFGMLIYYLAAGQGWLARGLAWRPIEYLGRCSYALYIVHTGVIQSLRLSIIMAPAPMSREVAIAAAVTISILLAIVVHRRIEVPCQRWLRSSRRIAATPAPLVQPA